MMRITMVLNVILSSSFGFHLSYECTLRFKYRSSSSFSSTPLSVTEYSMDSNDGHWVTSASLKLLADELHEDFRLFTAIHSDVAYYNKDSTHPQIYRIRKKFAQTKDIVETSLNPTNVPKGVDTCTRQTLRWCLNFVSGLKLCPWAKLSLKDGQAIRLKIVEQSAGLNHFETIIRESAQELIRISDEGYVDPNVAITFIVAIGDSKDFEFEQFYDFSSDLEERLFEEADISSNDLESCIGEQITIAPFHPDWTFAAEDGTYTLNALDFEKKSPFPTLSLVRTFVIDQAGEEATSIIGIHNEKILVDYGVEKLQRIYDQNVLLDG